MDRSMEYEFWQSLDMAWYSLKTEISNHVLLTVAFVAVIILLWVFLAPSIRNK
jgi:hypothetical protein